MNSLLFFSSFFFLFFSLVTESSYTARKPRRFPLSQGLLKTVLIDSHRRAGRARVEEDRIYHQEQRRREQEVREREEFRRRVALKEQRKRIILEQKRKQEELRKKEEERVLSQWDSLVPHFKADLGEVSEDYLPDAIRALFHSIFFQRSFGILRVGECQTHCESLDICYATVPDHDFFDKLEKMILELEKKLKQGKKETLCFSFGRREMKKSFIVFSSQVFDHVWEKWSVSVAYKKRNSKSCAGDGKRERKRIENLVTKKIFETLVHAGKYVDHIPGNTMPLEDQKGQLILGMTFDWEFSFPERKSPGIHFLNALKNGPPPFLSL